MTPTPRAAMPTPSAPPMYHVATGPTVGPPREEPAGTFLVAGEYSERAPAAARGPCSCGVHRAWSAVQGYTADATISQWIIVALLALLFLRR